MIFCCEGCKQSEWNTQEHFLHFNRLRSVIGFWDSLLLGFPLLVIVESFEEISFSILMASPGCPHTLHKVHLRQIQSPVYLGWTLPFHVNGRSSACRQNGWYGSQQTAHHSISFGPKISIVVYYDQGYHSGFGQWQSNPKPLVLNLTLRAAQKAKGFETIRIVQAFCCYYCIATILD